MFGTGRHLLNTLVVVFSKVKLVNNLMFGIHLATAAEAMALGARAGLNVHNLFDIISTAAGNSWYYLLWIHLLAYQNGTNLFPLNLFNWAFKVTEEKLDEMQRRWCCKESVQWHKLGALWLHSNLEIILAVYWDYCWGTHFGNTLLPKLGKASSSPAEAVKGNFQLSGSRLSMKFSLNVFMLWLSFALCPVGTQVVVIMVTNQDQAQSILYGPQGAVPGKLFINMISFIWAVIICKKLMPDERES